MLITKDKQLSELRRISSPQTSRQKLNSKNFRSSKVNQALKLIHLDSDSKKWQILYLAKVKACSTHFADFTDAKKDIELKDDKKECLIELIDVLDENDA